MKQHTSKSVAAKLGMAALLLLGLAGGAGAQTVVSESTVRLNQREVVISGPVTAGAGYPIVAARTRLQTNGDYYQAVIYSNGAGQPWSIAVQKSVGGTSTAFYNPGGITVPNGDNISASLDATGSNPTTLSVTVKDATTGVTLGTFSGTDSAASLQSASASSHSTDFTLVSATAYDLGSPVSVSASDTRVYWSGNTYADGSGYRHVTQNASYFKTGFSGTSLGSVVDISAYHTNSIAQAHTTLGSGWGQWIVVIDGAAPVPVIVPDPGAGVATTPVVFGSGLAAGNHTIQAWIDVEDETDTYTPKDAQVVQSFTLDAGAALSAPSGAIAVSPLTLRAHGDSIYKGYFATDPTGASPSPNYPLSIHTAVLARALGCELANFGLSGQGWTQSAHTWNLTLPQTFPNFDSTHPATTPANLTYDLIGEGTNDGTNSITAAAQAMYSTARAADGPNTWIIEAVPFNGTHRSELQAALAAYKASNPSDTKVALIDPSIVLSTANSGGFYTFDGTHPPALAQVEYGAIEAALISQATAPPATNTTTYLTPTLTHNTSSQPVLAWPPDSTATGYVVLRSVDNRVSYQALATVSSSTLTYTDITRPVGGTVYYHVVPTH